MAKQAPKLAAKFSALFQPGSPWRSRLLGFGCGLLMGLAPAPLNAFPLAWIVLAPLWAVVVQRSSHWRSVALLWGIGYHGLALSWITGLHPLTWMGIPWLASVGITLFAWGFITLWGAALVVIWAAVLRGLGGTIEIVGQNSESPAVPRSQIGVSKYLPAFLPGPIGLRVLTGTAIWCGLEWVWSLGSLYWTALSYTQSPSNLAILHLGQLSGPSLVSGAIVLCNALLAEAWLAAKIPSPRVLPFVARRCVLSAVAIGLALHLLGFGLYSRTIEQPSEAALAVGIVQGNVPTRIKLSASGIRRAIDGYTQGYRALAQQGADAILTPEGALPMLWDRDRSEFFQAVQQEGKPAWLGTFVREGATITQSLLTLTREGETGDRYNKIKLVPLGEYIPFRDVLGVFIDRLSPIKTDLSPGLAQQQFDTPFGRAIASICYDSAFPEVFRFQAAQGGEFILTASNLDPYSEVLMAQHQAQDIMRAIETDRWLARATNTGYSGILDPHGRLQWRSQPRQYELHVGTLYRRQTKTLYVRWGDWFTPLLVVGAIVGQGVQRWRNFM